MEKFFKTLDDKFKDATPASSVNHGVSLSGKEMDDLYILTEKLNQDIENQQLDFANDKKKIVTKQKEKLNYLAKICVDAKIPLAETFTMLELLRGTKMSDDQANYINILENSLDIVDYKLQQAYDYSQVETGEFIPEFTDFNLQNLLITVYEKHKIKAFKNNIDLNMIIEEKLWNSYTSDPYRIEQVLNSILTNAIEFTDNGEIEFIVQQTQHFGTMSEIKFIIRDTGNGVKMDKMSKLFQQVKIKYSSNISNSEHELEKSDFNIITKIAQYMGGDLKIESSGYQGGIQFALTLPLEISNN